MSLKYEMALTLIQGVGDVNGRKLVSYCGSAEAVFREKKSRLLKIPGIGEGTATAILNGQPFDRVERELQFMEKFGIRGIFFTDTAYPARLKNCSDAPLLLYYKGNAPLDLPCCLSIVGTRRATEYGREFIDKLMAALAPYPVLIISGLAFGIDTAAHRQACDHGLANIAVLGHGLDRIYPFQNRALAQRILGNGGLLTEFPSQTNPDRENFPRRNRIIAGLSDATLVVETGIRGGSIITADIANSYNRDVFALPGRVTDSLSEGCNWLIKTNRAALVDSPEELIESLGWETGENTQKPLQSKLFVQLSPDEELIVAVLKQNGQTSIDLICIESKLPATKTAAALLNLEFQGVVKCLPGKVYKLV